MLDIEEDIANLWQRIGSLEERIKRMAVYRSDASMDAVALEIARQVDDLFAQGHAGAAQRTAKVQILVREAIRAALDGTTDWRAPADLWRGVGGWCADV